MTKPSPAATAAAPPPPASTDEGERKSINQELWQACAGPLVNLPAAGTHVVYFPQGHSEQVAASMRKDVDGQIPNYPNLSSKLLCVLHNVMLHADPETDEVYAQMTLQPVPSFDKEALLMSDLSLKVNKPQTEFFCKTLTPSDTSTHGGFSVPRRAAEKIFPPLDFSMQPPAQELTATDLHDNVWTFRHVYRGQPKRHLLTTGWSHFVGGKRLIAGDSVLFIRDEKQNLLVGLRRANRQPTNLSYSMLSSDSMHIGVLAAAAHAAANNSPFTVFYNPRASPSEFVIPLAKYYRAAYNQQISLGMRFRMLFETEESGTRRYMGTITSISDLDPVRWKNSQWRNLQVGWDESTGGERRKRVSAWEIEPVTAPFFIHPPFFGAKHPRQPDVDPSEFGNLFKRNMPWHGDDIYIKEPQAYNGFTLAQQASMRQNPSLANLMQTNLLNPSPGFSLQGLPGADISHQLGFAAPQITQQNNMQFNVPRHMQPAKQPDQLQSSSGPGSSLQPQQQLPDISSQSRQHFVNQTLIPGQVPSQILQSPTTVHMQNTLQSTSPLQNSQHQGSIDQSPLQQQQQPIFDESWRNSLVASQLPKQSNQLSQVTNSQAQFELLQKFEHHQQSQLSQQSTFQQPSQLTQIQGPQKPNLSQSFCTSVAPSLGGVMQQPQATTQSQSQILAHQVNRNSGENNLVFTNLLQMQKLQQQQQQPCMVSDVQGHVGFSSNSVTDHPPIVRGCNFTGAAAGQSASTGVALTGSTPSTNNIANVAQTVVNTGPRSNNVADLMAQSSAIILNTSGLDTTVTNGNSCTNNIPSIVQTAVNMGPQTNNVGDGLTRSLAMPLNVNGMETMVTHGNSFKDFHQKSDIRPPSVNVSKPQHQEPFEQQAYENVPGSHLDYLDTSSATSVSLSQGHAHLERNNSASFNSQANFSRDRSQCNEVQAEPGNRNIDSQLATAVASESLLTKSMVGSIRDFSNFSSGGLITNYENCNDAQQELSSSMVTQSFGVADVAFNSIDSAMNESQFPNQAAWPPPPPYQRIRTYTKVYKRGAVGRSVDVTRYSGYEELKQDLARRFGIEGQLEDRGRVGWKLVYVDHENDVLLVGDDPWEEFIRCVRCIKILSPQEVQQMSLDGEYTNPSLPNQACSSSDGGNL